MLPGMAGQKAAANTWVHPLQGSQRLGTIHARHAHVQENQVNLEAEAVVKSQGLKAVGRLPDIEPLAMKNNLQEMPDRLLVIHDQNARHPGRKINRAFGFCGRPRQGH